MNRGLIVPAGVIDAASHCKFFAPITQHASNLELIRPERRASEWELILHQALADDALVHVQEITKQVARGLSDELPGTIDTVCVPTRDRPKMLARLLTSLSSNLEASDRHVNVMVGDDSSTPQLCAASRSIASSKATRSMRVTYIGPEERGRFATGTARRARVAPEIFSFAVLRNDPRHVAVGSMRNTLLLMSAGRRIMFIDDDVLCDITPIPGGRSDSIVGVRNDSTETWFLPKRPDASDLEVTGENVLELFDAALNIRALVTPPPWAGAIDPSTISISLLRKICEKPSAVVVSQIGVAGDCAMDFPLGYFTGGAADLDRLTASPDVYRAAMLNRAVIRGTTIFTLSNRLLAAGYCMGVDNRALLAPFLPSQRGEELVFGALLTKCIRGALISSIPRAILHAPAQERRFEASAMADRAGVFTASSTIARLIEAERMTASNSEDALRSMGHRLGELSRTNDLDLNDAIRSATDHVVCSLIVRLDSIASGNSVARYDARRALAACIRNRGEWDYSVPFDLGKENGRKQLRCLLGQLSLLLESWPAIFAAAKAQGEMSQSS